MNQNGRGVNNVNDRDLKPQFAYALQLMKMNFLPKVETGKVATVTTTTRVSY